MKAKKYIFCLLTRFGQKTNYIVLAHQMKKKEAHIFLADQIQDKKLHSSSSPDEDKSCGRGFSAPRLGLARRETWKVPENMILNLIDSFFAELWILLSRWFEIFDHLRHLAVSNEGVVLYVQVPHFHEVLLSGVDVREVVDHLRRLYPQPALEERNQKI